MSEPIQVDLNKLEELEKELLQVARHMIEAYGGAIYEVDLFAASALNRSLALSSGFSSLIRTKNLLCAGALLRLQIDTAIRFFASTLVNDPNQFVAAVIQGVQIRNTKDRDGKRMTDKYLVSKLSVEYPWLAKVYEGTSAYVHFSGTHVFASVYNIQDDGVFSMKISAKDREFPDELYIEAVKAFNEATRMLLRFISAWVFTKSYPEIAAEIREKILNGSQNMAA